MYTLSGDFHRRFYTYELFDPRDGVVFYVGKGSLASGRTSRYRDHIRIAKRGGRGRRYNLIRELLAANLKPGFRIVLEGVTEDEAYAEERRLIQHYGLVQLTNVCGGGNGGPCGVQCGDNHWTRRHPNLVLRGDRHPLRRDPSRAARGLENGAHTRPERRRSGENHGCAKLTLLKVTEIRDSYSAAKAAGQKVTGRDLARRHGVTPKQVSRILRGESWNLPSLIEKHGNAKLTQAQIASIPALIRSGLNQKEVAAMLHVSRSLVNYYVITGRDEDVTVELVAT